MSPSSPGQANSVIAIVRKTMEEKRILFVCMENSGRSQMAQAFAEKYGLNATSAGSVPSSQVYASIIEAMKEKGIDLSRNVQSMLTPEMLDRASVIITMDCSIARVVPMPIMVQMRRKLVDWDLKNPKGKSLPLVRKIRDDIEKKVIELSKE